MDGKSREKISMTLKILFIKSLPSVPIANLSALPKSPGVYYACVGFRVLYVGMSSNLYLRWNSDRYGEHHRLAEIKASGGSRLHYREMPLYWTEYFEAKEIQSLKPPLNRVRPDPRKLLTMRIRFDQFLHNIGFVFLFLISALVILIAF